MRRSFPRGDGPGLGTGPAVPLPPRSVPAESSTEKTPAAAPQTDRPEWPAGTWANARDTGKETEIRMRRRWSPPWCPPERPCPPGEPPCPPGDPHYPPGAPDGPSWPSPPCPGGGVQLAEAFVPWQVYNGYCPPGQLEAPGTIFPEILRTPPLYQYPPGTGGRRG